MKKGFTALASLAMVVTVGGVYATWNYTQNNAADFASAEQSVKLASEVITNQRIGTITVKGNGGIKIDDPNGDHAAEITLEESTYFTIVVTPKAGWTVEDLKTAGKNGTSVTLQYTVEITGVPNQDGDIANYLICTKTGTISGDDLVSGERITFAVQDFDTDDDQVTDYSIATEFVFGSAEDPQKLELHTVEEYRAYHDMLTGAKITIKVTDITEYDEYTQQHQ